MTTREPPTILLVDDEADILVALGDLLEDQYRLLTTTSPQTALEMLARERDVAVIVSDQRMPEMPGNVFLGRAREVSRAETLLLTGYADIEAVISAVNDGRIGGYAHKPWEPEPLRAMIAAAAERYRLRRALSFEQALFAALIEKSHDNIGILDRDGALLRGDPAILRAGETDADHAALASGVIGDEEIRSHGADGLPRFRRVQRFPVTIDGSAYLLKIESDESARHALEQRLQQSEKLQALGTLAGGIAHDFNNLLTAVLGNLELAAARAGDGDERLRRYITSAGEAAKRGANLTKRLLSFTRQGEIAADTIDPNALVTGVEELIARTIGGRIDIALDLAADVWPIRIEAEQLELALLNLAINAKDAMPGGGTVRFTTANLILPPSDALGAGDYVAIAVADAGEGMSEDVAARVFEPFFTTKERGRGTGLGLPMVHALATNAGGRVELSTALGGGTTVTILLPRDDMPIDRAGPAASDAPVATRPLRILLIEDDADVRAVSREALADLGHDVVEAASGDEALDVLDRDQAFDLILTDFAMPGMTGLDIAETVIARWPGMPIVMISGFAEVGGLPAGVTTIRKPFTRSELASALAARIA